MSTTVLMYKKGEQSLPSNWRAISAERNLHTNRMLQFGQGDLLSGREKLGPFLHCKRDSYRERGALSTLFLCDL